MIKIYIQTILSLLLFTGCSLMPYSDNFSCQKGKNSGVCASISDVYQMTEDKDLEELKKLKVNSKNCNCNKKQDIQRGKAIKNTDNNDKDLIQAISINQLQNEKNITVIINNNEGVCSE